MRIEGIQDRSKQCMADLLDLSTQYNRLTSSLVGDKKIDLAEMPLGLKLYCKIAFDVRGMIQLSGNKLDVLPIQSEKMFYSRRCWKIYFLHGAIGKTECGVAIGEYCINYSDGVSRSIPIIYGVDVADGSDESKNEIPYNASVAWPEMALNDIQYKEKVDNYTGPSDLPGLVKYETDKYSASSNSAIASKVFCLSVNNPRPEVIIESIIFRSFQKGSAPFLMAVTLQPHETTREGFYDAIYFDGSRPTNPIYPRDKNAGRSLIDLSEYYTASLDDDFHFHPGHDLQELPKGLTDLKGTTFDIRGLIQLGGKDISLWRTGAIYLDEVKGIKVYQFCKKMHFIHGAGWRVKDGVPVAEYIIRYKNNDTRHISLTYGENIGNWWDSHNSSLNFDSNTKVAWKGTNSCCHNIGEELNLQKFTWNNDLPQVEIETIDFVSLHETVGPFLVAITLED